MNHNESTPFTTPFPAKGNQLTHNEMLAEERRKKALDIDELKNFHQGETYSIVEK